MLLLGDTFVLKDWLLHALASHEFLADSLRDLRFPAWCDTVRFGIPFAANPDHRALYLPFWLIALFPSPLGSDLVVLAHVAAGGVGTGLLASRWGAGRLGSAMAACLFCCSGYIASAIVLQLMPMLAWIPWIAWAADRLARARPRGRIRATALFATMYSGIVVCGEPSSVIAASFLAIVVVLARGRNTKAALATAGVGSVLGAAMAAPVILPAISLMAASSRSQGLDPAAAARFSMHPLRIIETVWPRAFGGPDYTTSIARVIADSAGLEGLPGDVSWAESLFIGAPALVLVAVALHRRRALLPLGVAALAFVVLAMGRFTPVYALYRAVFVPERAARYPEKYFVGALVIAAALAGVGLSGWARRRPRPAARWGTVAVAIALLAGWTVVLAMREQLTDALATRAASFPFPLHPAAGLDVALHGGAFAFLATAVFAAAFWRGTPRPSLPRTAILVCTTLLPVIANAWRTNHTVSRDVIAAPPRVLAPALAAAGSARPRLLVQKPPVSLRDVSDGSSWASFFHENAREDIASRFGLQVLSGSDSFNTPAQEVLWNTGELQRLPLKYAALGGGDFALVRAEIAARVAPRVESSYERMALVRVVLTRPRAFVTPDWFWVPPGDDVAALTLPGRLARLERVSLTGVGEPAHASWAPSSPCEVSSDRPEHVIVRCNSEVGGYAVLLDSFGPGWTARVDGAPARMETADALFRGVRVGSGAHTIEFRYSVPGLAAGSAISTTSFIGLAAALLWHGRRRPRNGPPSAADPEPRAFEPRGTSPGEAP